MPNLEADWLQRQQRRSTLGGTSASRAQQSQAPFLFGLPKLTEKQQRTGESVPRFKVLPQSSDGRARMWRGSILPSLSVSECGCHSVAVSTAYFLRYTLSPLAPAECLSPFMVLSSDGNFLCDAVKSVWTQISLECLLPVRVRALVSAGTQGSAQYNVYSFTVISGCLI